MDPGEARTLAKILAGDWLFAGHCRHDLARIQSVASFFVSGMDTEVDRRLEAIGSCEALAQRGRAAIASARYAFSVYTEAFTGSGWLVLAGHGAAKQRPL